MSDIEFIERLNNYIIKYGYMLIDCHEENKWYKYGLMYMEESRLHYFFENMDVLLNGNTKTFSITSLFEYLKTSIFARYDKYVKNVDSILMVCGSSKEEIILKLQMMGY